MAIKVTDLDNILLKIASAVDEMMARLLENPYVKFPVWQTSTRPSLKEITTHLYLVLTLRKETFQAECISCRSEVCQALGHSFVTSHHQK